MKLNKAREELKNKFLECLKAEQMPWSKTWHITQHNGKSKRKYRGVNALLLAIVSDIQQYSETRWYTFNQIKEAGYSLKKGAKGVPIEYWLLYDTVNKEYMSFEKAQSLIKENPEIEKDLELRSRTYYVFNGDLIQGLPAFRFNQEATIEREDVLKYLENLINGMEIKVSESTLFNPAYNPEKDIVMIPPKKSFLDFDHYVSTLLHELAHATGNEKRMNRSINGNHFGDENYAYEELCVEIASSFLAQDLQIDQTEEHKNLHLAYVQSWIKCIENDDKALFRAIKKGEEICQYMENIMGLEISLTEDCYTEIPTVKKNLEDENAIKEVQLSLSKYIDTKDLIQMFHAVQLRDGLFNDIRFFSSDGEFFEEIKEAETVIDYVQNEDNQMKLAQWIIEHGMEISDLLESVNEQTYNHYAMQM